VCIYALPTLITKVDNVSLVVSTVKTNRDVLAETVEINTLDRDHVEIETLDRDHAETETLDRDHVETNQDLQALDNVIVCFWQSLALFHVTKQQNSCTKCITYKT
jgi:hypothetical protein